MKIGIYLAYPPSFNPISLRKEGLGRYLSFLVKGFVDTKNNVVIACPKWAVDSVNELFDEEGIKTERIEIISSSNEPILFQLYKWYLQRGIKKEKKSKKRLEKVALKLIDIFADWLITTKNIALFATMVLLFAVLSIIVLPLMFIILVLTKIVGFIMYVFGKFFSPRKISSRYFDKLRNLNFFEKILHYIHTHYDANEVREKIRLDNAYGTIRKIKNMKNPMDVWYCPTAFWEEFNKIDGLKVICAPDIVTAEFPGNFAGAHLTSITKKVSKVIQEGTFFITYSDYLKRDLLINKFFKQDANVKVIEHAPNNMLPHLNLASYFRKVQFKEDANKYFARKIILPMVINNNLNMMDYLFSKGIDKNFAVAEVDFIFYASQIRGNKNILNLIKAYEILLRRYNMPLKLFLTGNFNLNPEIKDYIYQKRLQYDVLSFCNVSSQALAALYMCSKLVVNPTFYEGGFPFTFSEGMSVGVPSVMSKIPQVMEVVDGYGLDDYLFDPYNLDDMVKKIKAGLDNTQKLYKLELPLYSDLSKRTWEDVSKEHLAAFEYFSKRNSE